MKNNPTQQLHSFHKIPIMAHSILPPPVMLRESDVSYPKKINECGLRGLRYLHAIGNLDILDLPAVAIIGSRKCSDKGIELASKIAATISQAGIAIVSGYARGIDTAAHLGALQCDGFTVFVLPFGIYHFRIKRELRAFSDVSKFLALSQFPAKQRWFASAAMQRNRLICALADAIVVIEAGETGGTVEGARAAKELGKRIYVIKYASPPPTAIGNQKLLSELSAHPLSNWHEVIEFIGHLKARRSEFLTRYPKPIQESLF